MKALMFSNRVLFVQDRPCGDMTFDILQNGINCISVKSDFSDLEEKYKWVESQGERFQEEIGQNMLKDANTHCRRIHAYNRIKSLVHDLID